MMGKGESESMLTNGMRERLRTAREALGMRSGDVARQLGIPESSYSRYETGVTPIPVQVLAALDRLYGITPSYIITGSMVDLPQALLDALDAHKRQARAKAVNGF